jgi:DNA topoisomerase-3
MAAEEVTTLLRDKRLGPLQGFRSKQGKPFSAALRFTDKNKVEFIFEGGPDGEKPEIVNPEPLGKSPVDGTPVFETVTSYQSESGIQGDAQKGFRLGKVILGKTQDRENVRKMLEEGKTGLLQGFQSSKTRRFFDAYLKVTPQGKIQFEFPPREFKGRRKAAPKSEASEG